MVGSRRGELVREIAGHSDVRVTMTVDAHDQMHEKAAALTRLGTAVAGALPSPVAVNPLADDRHDG